MACRSESAGSGMVAQLLAGLGVLIVLLSCSVPAFGEYEVVPGSYLIQADEIPHGGVLDVADMAAGVPFKLATVLGESGQGAEAYRIGRDYCHHKLKSRVRKIFRLRANKFQQKVKICSANQVYRVSAVPNDSSYSSLWGMTKIGAPTAWNTTTGSSQIVVGVVDTGIQYNHPDLAANMWTNSGEIVGNGIDDDSNGYIDDIYGIDAANTDSNPIDDHNHGTHCAGTIGGVGNNGVGVAGVNWNVKMMALKFLGSTGSGSTAGAITVINYATMMKNRGVNLRVLSNSWGGGGYDAALANAIKNAGGAGILFVAAAGNSGSNNDTSPAYPASYDFDNIISVAATDSVDGRALFSNYGAISVDLGAPGVSILSTVTGNAYASYSGTSMATPHVAGAAALVLAKNASLTVAELKSAILQNVDPVASMSGVTVTGGRLNVGAALASVRSAPPAETPTPTATPTPTPTPTATPTPTPTPAAIVITLLALDDLKQPLAKVSGVLRNAETNAVLGTLKTNALGVATRSFNSRKYAALLSHDVLMEIPAAPAGYTMNDSALAFTVGYTNELTTTGTALTFTLSGNLRVRKLTGVGNRTTMVLAAGAEILDADGVKVAEADQNGHFEIKNIRYKKVLVGYTARYTAEGKNYQAVLSTIVMKSDKTKNAVLNNVL